VVKQSTELPSFNGTELIVGIRPESLTDPASSGNAAEPGASLTAEVELVEVLGTEQLVHFQLDAQSIGSARPAVLASARSGERGVPGGRPPGLARPAVPASARSGDRGVPGGRPPGLAQPAGVARVSPRASIQPHGRTVLAVDTERLHFFDPATGAAIC
jgi:multiple sugar transport system ATP-binding protein